MKTSGRVAGFLAVALVSCGGHPQAQASPALSVVPSSAQGLAAAPTPAPTPTLDASLNVVFGSIFFGRSGEPHCPRWPGQTDNVVLAQDKLTYSADEIGRIAAADNGGMLAYDRIDPSVLAVKPGVATGGPPVAPSDILGMVASPACVFELDVTNAGPSPVQIIGVGLRLTTAVQPNPEPYRLVEFCSVLNVGHWCGPQLGAGPSACAAYGVEIALSDQQPGFDFVGAPQAIDYRTNQPCPQVTLQQQQTVSFVVGAYSTSPSIYNAVPILVVETPTSQATAAYPQLPGAYAFADPSQFTCYKLSGSTFVPWKQGAAAYDFDANARAGAWCP